MADLLQKVFVINVRPYYVDGSGNKVFYTSDIYGPVSNPDTGARYQLLTNNTTGEDITPIKLNESGLYNADPWFLHSSYTSYNQFRDALKGIIAIYGTSNVKCSIHIPIDYEVLPNQ